MYVTGLVILGWLGVNFFKTIIEEFERDEDTLTFKMVRLGLLSSILLTILMFMGIFMTNIITGV